MKHLFIVNPIAGSGKVDHNANMKYIHTFMEKRSEDFEIYVTKAPLDAIDKIKKTAAECSGLRVYACGGDGTFNECVNGAAGFDHVAVTAYPCGTGNDFIRMFGDESTLFSTLSNLVDGTVRPFDIIDCNGRYSVNICSIGFDARVAKDVHKYSKLPVIGGACGYVISLIANLAKGINRKLKITFGDKVYDGKFALICACNGRYYGGGFMPVPDAMPDDGIIEALLVKAVSRLQFLSLVGKYAKGKARELKKFVISYRGQRIKIESNEDLVVNIDGELISTKVIEFKMIHRGVNIIIPSGIKNFKFTPELVGI